MDYEKAHKEALKRAKKELETCGSLDCDAARLIFRLFPQLAESEDERIRKWIANYIHRGVFDEEEYPKALKAIEYLEKQKEQSWMPTEGEMGVLYKLCYLSNQISDDDDTELTRLYQDLKREYFNGHSFENMFPKQKEPHYTKRNALFDKCVENCDSEVMNKVSDEIDEMLQKEQKPRIEICPHSTKSKSYKENGYPIEDCDYGLEIAYDILEKTFGEVRGYKTDDGIRGHQTAIEAVRKAKEQKPVQSDDEKEYIRTIKGIIADFIRDKKPGDVAYYQQVFDWLDGRHIEQKQVDDEQFRRGYEAGKNDAEREINTQLIHWQERAHEEMMKERFPDYDIKVTTNDSVSELKASGNVYENIHNAMGQKQTEIDLEEAAEKFARFYDQGTCDGITQECFKAGAEWMAKQLPLPEDSVAFQKGVQEGRRLEREDALTIDDIEKLHTFLYAVKNNKHGAFTFTRLTDEQYKEVLRRFNNARKEQ